MAERTLDLKGSLIRRSRRLKAGPTRPVVAVHRGPACPTCALRGVLGQCACPGCGRSAAWLWREAWEDVTSPSRSTACVHSHRFPSSGDLPGRLVCGLCEWTSPVVSIRWVRP